MALMDKLRDELDRAGKAAQGAFDEGKTRLEAFRTRQLADKAAQALGYAVFRAKQGGGEIDADTYSRLAATLATHDAEAARYEQGVEQKRRGAGAPADATAEAPSATAAADSASAAGTTSSSPYSSPPSSTDQDVSG
ncbi:MAG: hypothetical protein ACR2GK_12930 [Gemmatimonadaceae bacterium]